MDERTDAGLDVQEDLRTDTAADVTTDTVGPRDVPIGANVVFVTSQKYPMRFASLAAADEICAGLAAMSAFPGTYRAWLSTSRVNARDRLQGARGWIRPDGAPFADTVDDIVQGRIFNPPYVDERGQEVHGGMDERVVTGTRWDGLLDPEGICADWAGTASSSTYATAGVPEGGTVAWTSFFEPVPCDAGPVRLYCFGVDRSVPVTPVPASGRPAFITHNPFIPGGGVAAADALCATEATDAGLPGTFLAFLATTTAIPASRFAAHRNAVWVRLDGVPINRAGSSLFDGGRLLAPLNVTSKKGYQEWGLVFTGARDLSVLPPSSDTCDDWRSTNAQDSAPAGVHNFTPGWFFYDGVANCTADISRLYCLQN